MLDRRIVKVTQAAVIVAVFLISVNKEHLFTEQIFLEQPHMLVAEKGIVEKVLKRGL